MNSLASSKPTILHALGLQCSLWGWVFAATWLGLRIGLPWLLPILQTLPAYFLMLYWLRNGQWHGTLFMMLGWAAALAVAGAILVWLNPYTSGSVILRGEWYRSQMFQWLCTGVGMESTPSQFIPMHAREIILFISASLFTASLLSMLGGAILMNYMSYYVGSLMAASSHPLWVFFLAWKIYAVIRVTSFVILGVLLAEPLLSLITKQPYAFRSRRKWLLIALLGLILDVFLKILTAPLYRNKLLGLVNLPCS